MTEFERQSIRNVYSSLQKGSLLERRDRLVLAGIPLAEAIGGDFYYTFPSPNYTKEDMVAEAMLALVEVSAKVIDGRSVGSDVVGFLSRSIWNRLRDARDSAPAIGPGKSTVFARRNDKKFIHELSARAEELLASGDITAASEIEQQIKTMNVNPSVISIEDDGVEASLESSLTSIDGKQDAFDTLDEILDKCCEDLLDRTIVVYRSQGHSTEDIARFTGYSRATLSRRLSAIDSRSLSLSA